jgi:hypothetical protein
MAIDRDLTVAGLAQCPEVLPGDTDGAPALFGEAGVVEDQDAIALGGQGEQALDPLPVEIVFVPVDGRQEALEALLGGAGDDLGDGVAVLGGQFGEQSGEVAFQCRGPLTPVEVDAEGREELSQLGQWSAGSEGDSGRLHTASTKLATQGSLDKVLLEIRPDNVKAITVETSRRLLIRRRTGVRPVGAHGVPGRPRNEKPVSSMKTIAACFRRAFLPDPRPIVFEPGPDHFLIALFGANGRDLGAPTGSPPPSGQVIGMVRDPEVAPDQITNPSQGPASGLVSGREGALAEDPQDAAPLRVGQPRRSSRPGSAAQGFPPRGWMFAQLLGPVLNGPEADAQPPGDRRMSQTLGSEQSSSLQPTFFDLVLSQFARAPYDSQ